MPVPVIHTSRFTLRPLTPDDASDVYSRWLDDKQVRQFIVGAGRRHDVTALRAYIVERCTRSDVMFLGIFVTHGGTHIGNIKFEPVDERGEYAVMGILIGDPLWRGKGVAAEVISAATLWLAEYRGIREVVLGVELGHAAAVSAYQKAGFRIETSQRITLDPSRHVSMVLRMPSARRLP